MRMGLRRAICLAGMFTGLFCSAAYAVGVEDLVAYRGVYELQLESAASKSNITGLTGRMVYEFSGSKCEGFTTRFRFVTRVDMEEMPQRVTDQQTTSYESADGREFRFVSKSYTDQELTKELNGTAKIADKKIKVDITKPDKSEHVLPLAEFPNSHTISEINKAIAGVRFFKAKIFDGSEDGDKNSDVTVVIGDKRKPTPDAETKVMGKLGGEEVWPVTISYFDDEQNKDGLPTYRTSFLLYANGITRDLVMDYGDFSLRAKLVRLDVFDQDKAKSDCGK